MEISNRMNTLFVIFISLYGFACSQYLYCPADNWILGSTITFRCYLPKADYPSKCVTGFTDTVVFRRRFSGVPDDRCSLSAVSTSSCTGSSSECSCEAGNSTYYSVRYTFTVERDDNGTWECLVNCYNGLSPQLTYDSDNCENRNTVEPTTTTTTTTETTGSTSVTSTVPPLPTCDFCEFTDCRDTGGRSGCIAMIVCLIIAVVAGIVAWCLSYWCCRQKCEACCCCSCCFGLLDRCFGKHRSARPPPSNKPGDGSGGNNMQDDDSDGNDKPDDRNGGHAGPRRHGNKPATHSGSSDGHP